MEDKYKGSYTTYLGGSGYVVCYKPFWKMAIRLSEKLQKWVGNKALNSATFKPLQNWSSGSFIDYGR